MLPQMPLFVVLLLLSATTSVAGLPLSVDDAAKVAQGEIVIHPITTHSDAVRAFDMFGVVRHPPEQVFRAVACRRDYPQFMPNIARIDELESSGTNAIVNYTLALPLGKEKRYRLRIEQGRDVQGYFLRWQQAPWPELTPDQTIKDTRGFWRLTPASDPKHTFVHYQVYTDPGEIPFGLGWIVDVLTRLSLPGILEATRGWVATGRTSCP